MSVTVPSKDTVTVGGPWVAKELLPSRDAATGGRMCAAGAAWGPCEPLGDPALSLGTLHTVPKLCLLSPHPRATQAAEAEPRQPSLMLQVLFLPALILGSPK